MTSLALTNSEVLANIKIVMGLSRTGSLTTDQDNDIDRVVRSGQRTFYTAYEWSFLNPILLITTNEPYSTGTITVANGVVTGSGTGGQSFPTWATSAWMTFGSRRYGVATWTDATHLTLDNTDADNDAVAGTTYSLQRFEYALPTEFGGLAGDLIYDPDWSSTASRVIGTTWEQLRTSQARILQTGAPRYYATYPLAVNLDVGQEWRIMFDPCPDAVYRFRGRYRLIPGQMTSGDPYPAGDTIHAETMQAAILSAAENFYQAEPMGPHTIRYNQLLPRSIEYDKKVSSPHRIPRHCRNDEEWRAASRSIPGVYIGLTD